VEDHVAVDEALGVEDGLAAVDARGLGEDHEAVAGLDLAPKADIFHASEADESVLVEPDFMAVERAKLSGGLAHQDARHQGVMGHVAADPEFVVADVLVADDQVLVAVDVDDGGELLHLEPLGVSLADRFLVVEDVTGVDRGGIDHRDGRHANSSFRADFNRHRARRGHSDCDSKVKGRPDDAPR
jgi:hypothetical protein